MIQLLAPDRRYLKSYREAYREYAENHITAYGFTSGRSDEIFEKFDNYKYERNLKPGRVGADYYWLVEPENDFFIGEISIRHRLTDTLLHYGGHIGYGVRYSLWNNGYGTLMLKLALEKAGELGLHSILITCDDHNTASARVMEKNGFLLHDKVENTIDSQTVTTRRYWRTL